MNLHGIPLIISILTYLTYSIVNGYTCITYYFKYQLIQNLQVEEEDGEHVVVDNDDSQNITRILYIFSGLICLLTFICFIGEVCLLTLTDYAIKFNCAVIKIKNLHELKSRWLNLELCFININIFKIMLLTCELYGNEAQITSTNTNASNSTITGQDYYNVWNFLNNNNSTIEQQEFFNSRFEIFQMELFYYNCGFLAFKMGLIFVLLRIVFIAYLLYNVVSTSLKKQTEIEQRSQQRQENITKHFYFNL